jgi:uncharacterized membrane protein
LILAFIGVAYLVYFIHYISMSIQASRIIATVAHETIAAVDRLFPQELGDDADEDADGDLAMPLAEQYWSSAPAQMTGYVESIDRDAILCWAQEHRTILRMERGIGEFVIEGTPLISVAGSNRPDDETIDELNSLYFIGRYRTVDQDPSFGIRQLVDIALKALSPGINDTTTAVMCVDYLAAILVRLASRQIATAHRLDQGELRVIARGPSFASLLAEAFDQVRQNAMGNVAVLTRLLHALEIIVDQTTKLRRRQALRLQAELIVAAAERTILSPHDLAGIQTSWLRLSRVLNGTG